MKRMMSFMMMGLLLATGAAARERKDVPEQYKWNLADIYASQEDFIAARTAFAEKLPEIVKFRGTLADGPQAMKACLDAMSDTIKTYSRLSSYASMNADTNLKDQGALKLKQETRQIGIEFSKATAWLVPEILSLGEEKIRAYLDAEPGLKDYRMQLEEIIRTGGDSPSRVSQFR